MNSKLESESLGMEPRSVPREAVGVALIEATDITKAFAGVNALHSASLKLSHGQILGIVGENGAGKSTLMKVLAGIHPRGTYAGSFNLEGQECQFASVKEARNAGIVLIPQELSIAPNLSIAENMFAGDLPQTGGFVNEPELAARAAKWLEFFEIEVSGFEPASVLSPSQQRLAMMAGALSRNAKVLILDEPTASLSEGETVILFQHLRRLSKDKIGIVFISHRLDDIEQVCDQVIIMRNGKIVKSLSREDFDREEIVSSMIGRSLTAIKRSSVTNKSSQEIFSAESVMVHDPIDNARYRVENFSMTTKQGEIVGLFGLVGAGRTEFARAVFGTWPGKVSGEFKVGGNRFVPSSPKHAVKNGIGFLTEDRKQTGIFTGLSLTWNVDSASLKLVSKLGFISQVPDKVRTRNLMEQLDVRAQSSDQNIETLSGGNQQKILLGRWLATSPKLLILDEPTAGVDVGAREEIYQRVEALASSGCSILVISSDLDEISRLCNRTYVISGGRLTGEFEHNVSRQDLMAAATKRLRVATN